MPDETTKVFCPTCTSPKVSEKWGRFRMESDQGWEWCSDSWHDPELAAPLEGTPLIDDTFVAQIEDQLGMGHGAWDTIDPIKICKAVAAAVSKNSREDAIQPYIQRIEEIGGALKKTDEERKRAEARISELEQAQRWISVEERLPEESGDYFVWVRGICDSGEIKSCSIGGRFSKPLKVWFVLHGWLSHEVQGWMKVPEPPQ